MLIQNGFRMDEVYLMDESKKIIMVEPSAYFDEFETKYKFLAPVSFTFFKAA